jgi:REP element-mobilizing transposase RayT
MKKYLNKYRIPSARLPNWDYGQPALYFITICTHKRIRYFGTINKNFVGSQLNVGLQSNVGSQLNVGSQSNVETRCIASLPGITKIQLSEMGCIVEREWLKTFELRHDMNLFMGEFIVMPDHFHAIIGIGENPYNSTIKKNEFGFQSKNLASVIRGFKSAVTMAARKINPSFQWQTRFHDHLIRNEKSHQNISQYIIDNPIK